MTDQREIRYNILAQLEAAKPLAVSFERINEHARYVDSETRPYEVRQALAYLTNAKLIHRPPRTGMSPERYAITGDGLAKLNEPIL